MTIFIVVRLDYSGACDVLRCYKKLGDARAYVARFLEDVGLIEKVGDDRWQIKGEISSYEVFILMRILQ